MPPERKRKPRSPAHAALGQVIEQITAERGMSQSAFAQKAGMDIRRINSLVCGQANPTYESLLRLCDALDIPLNELMRRVEARSRPASARSEARDAEARPYCPR